MFWARLTEEQINIDAVLAEFQRALQASPAAQQIGARVIFSGEIRNFSHGKEVVRLEYTAHKTLAEKHMLEVVRAATQQFPLIAAMCLHRIGLLDVAESAVIVVTAGRHRAETYAANRYIIDRVKAETPIWKKEFFADGTSLWGENCNDAGEHSHVH
ncbi:MAG: molybdenum cofactor biosynthesis protein MoaE [Spirochaetes bacterium]|nr:molybdenum cofactor biosynthesis protein MoaE [Spirochaetota bacterium]